MLLMSMVHIGDRVKLVLDGMVPVPVVVSEIQKNSHGETVLIVDTRPDEATDTNLNSTVGFR